MGEEKSIDTYALRSGTSRSVPAPTLDYRPPMPKAYRPRIALIGTGGITQAHCDAYRSAGFDVAAFHDIDTERATARRDAYFPDAEVVDSLDQILRRTDIEVVDIATHVSVRADLIQAAIEAGKHVLSQKPFVLDLDHGDWLCGLARRRGVRLAVNQNGRWAPHLAWIRAAVRTGRIGDPIGVHAAIHWDHTWVAGTPFETYRDLILADFGIHWFDFVSSILGDRPVEAIHAQRGPAAGQTIAPPLSASVLMAFDGGQASLIFDAATRFGSLDQTVVAGTEGLVRSTGPDLGDQQVTLVNGDGTSEPHLEGKWFNDGFAGTMGELLVAIEEGREPDNGAHANLRSLALCFAAVASADDGSPKRPGDIRCMPAGALPG
ncbi:MAG: Gfo/Idh/MocA family protein [Armatimonadota bacterium]